MAAREIDCADAEMLVASTGVIGEPLPMEILRSGIPRVAQALSPSGFEDAAEAIRTTDSHAKIASTRFRLGSRLVTILGIAKALPWFSREYAGHARRRTRAN